MRGPRKRTLWLAALLVVGLLVGGTANSSEASRRNSGARKNHSTSVKKEKQSKSSTNVANAVRRAIIGTQFALSQRATLPEGQAEPETEAPGVVATVRDETAGGGTTPRAALAKETAESSPSRIQPTTARDEAIRAALARRTGSEPRGSSPEPAKVQGPPVDRVGELPEVAAAGEEPDLERADNDDLIREALTNRGKPYIWGGASRSGFDCSGFVCYLFRKMRGLNLPHSASAQARLGTPVGRASLQPGDLVFFSTYKPGISHVGIYIGENRFIHAANRRRDTRIDTLAGYYANRYRGARRISPAPLRLTPKDLNELMNNASELPM